jgi:Ca-activated chloride channel homolog
VQFIQSSWLWLLWLIPPLAALYALAASRRRAALRRFAEERFMGHLVPGRSPARNALRIGLIGVALVLAIFSLAGPSWGFSWEKVERRGVDLVVALDLSRSMLAQDVGPDRLTAAKREIRDLLSLLEGDRVGLVVFAGSAFIQCPLTLDYNAFEVFLSQLDPGWVPIGGTDLGAAVRTATETFIAEERSGRAVVLITDGEDHGGALREAAQEAKAEGVHVFVVGIGSPEGVPIPDGDGGFIKDGGRVVLSKLDEGALKELAMTTGGSYVRSVSGMADLEQIYLEDIKQTLESRALTSSRQRRSEERFQWFLLPAFLLLFAEPLFGPRRSRAARRASGGATAVLALSVALFCVASPTTAQAGLFGDDPQRDGYAAFKKGDFQGALSHWLAAQTADPDDRELDYDIGQAHFRLGQFPEAEKAFLAASAGQDRELAADALYNTGNALFEQGRYLDSISAYDRALEIRADDEDAIVNRDLAQRRYEELIEQARDEEQERQEEQEEEPQDQSDAECDNPQEGEEGEEGEESQQEQKQGQGMSEEEQPKDGAGSGEDEEEKQEQPEGADDGEADEQQELQGGQAEAADIDRDAPQDEEEKLQGAIAEDTVEDGEGDGEPQPAEALEGALTEEQAEALLQALRADQEQRRQERTRREAARGRRAASKDW